MTQPLPQLYDFTLERGDTRVWEVHFTDTDTNLPVDLTGWTFLSQIRSDLSDSSTVLATVAVADTDLAGGVITLTLTSSESANVNRSPVVWDLQATKADGSVKTYLYNYGVTVAGDASR